MSHDGQQPTLDIFVYSTFYREIPRVGSGPTNW